MTDSPDRGKREYARLVDRGVAIRTLGRLLNIHRSNMTLMGEQRGFHPRHHDRLQLSSELVGRLPKEVPANEWLKTPHPSLGGRSPLDLISAYGGGAPIPHDLALVPAAFEEMPRQRWWTTWLALVEIPAEGLTESVRHLRSHLSGQRGRDGDEHLTVDIRWAYSADGYPSTFVIAEVGSLHRPRRTGGRWEAIINQPLEHTHAWFGMGYAEPLREALLTHWHSGPNDPNVCISLNDTPLPMDHYDERMFTKRTLWRPPSPPWTGDERNQIVRFVKRLVDGGPRLAEDHWPFPSIRDGCEAEHWTLWRPFEDESLRIYRGGLRRSEYEFYGRRLVNTKVRDPAGHGVDPGDPRAFRILTSPDTHP